MANLATILKDLTTEVRVAIVGITPNTMAGTDNSFQSPKSLEKQNIREQSGKPRLFQVRFNPGTGIDAGTGFAIKTYLVKGTVTIGYPNNAEWDVARASDASQIFGALNNTDGPAGCNYRIVPEGEEPEIEEVENDWIWMIVPLRAAVTTS